MVLRTKWAACTAALLSLSVSRADGPAGDFFVARHQRSRRQQLLDGQVQQLRAIAPPLLDREGRLRDVACGLGHIASTAAAVLGGGGRREGQQSRKSTETVESCSGSSSNHATAAGAAEQNPGAVRPGFPGQLRGLSSPFEALSLTSRQLGQRASSTMAALGLREGKQRSATLLTRGGGGGGAPQAPPTSPPPQQVDRWKNAVEGLKNGLASGLAAACVKTVLQPFDTMKTVQQFSTTR